MGICRTNGTDQIRTSMTELDVFTVLGQEDWHVVVIFDGIVLLALTS